MKEFVSPIEEERLSDQHMEQNNYRDSPPVPFLELPQTWKLVISENS